MLKPTFYLIMSCIAQLRAGQFEGMIVGGQFAKIVDYPHSVFLSAVCGQDRAWVCGGSIVNQKIILTAAHCVYGPDCRVQIRARVGSSKNTKGSIYEIVGLVIHEEYKQPNTLNDIALLKTDKAIKFNKKVGRVALMKKPPYTEDAMVAGWGLIDEENNLSSPQLKAVYQKVWSRSDCVRTLKKMPQGTICAAADSVLEYASSGDSGSALVVRGYIQIGLVSCNKPSLDKHLMIYVDVGYHYKWIKSRSRVLYCS